MSSNTFVARDSSATKDQPFAGAGAERRVQVLTQFEHAKTIWRDLVNQGAMCSRYQHMGWMSRWWENIGRQQGMEPYLVVLRNDAGKAIMLLPLVRKRIGPLHVGMFMGGKHANFNLPIWRAEYIEEPSFTIKALANGLRKAGRKLDLLLLLNQPGVWRGKANPLLAFPHIPSPGTVHTCTLRPNFEELLKERVGGSSRKKLRQKERMLGAQGVVSSRRARTDAEIAQVLEAFFNQKRARMNELGMSNVFDSPGVKEFIASAASEVDPDTGDSIIELYATFVGDTVAATFGGIYADGRFNGMFNSMTPGEMREHSPGDLLLTNVIRMCCERGAERFDLGVGDAAYKKTFCNEEDPLYDSIVPLTALGHLGAPLYRQLRGLKAVAKRSDLAMNAIRFLRNKKIGSSAS